VAVAILVVLRAIVAVAIPIVVRRVAASRGLACDWDRLSIGLLAGTVDVRNLDAWPLGDDGRAGPRPAEPPVHLEYATVDVHLLSALFGPFHVQRAEVDGLDVALERAADGVWKVAGRVPVWPLPPAPPPTEAPRPPEKTPEKPEPFDLALPVRVDALRIQHVRARLVDPTAVPAVDLALETTLRVSDLGSPVRPARLDVLVTAPGALDVVRVAGRLEGDPRSAKAHLEVEGHGLRLAPLRSWLASFGVEPHAEALAFGLRVDGEADVLGEKRDALRAAIALRDAHLDADGVRELALDELSASVDPLTRSKARVPLVELKGVRGAAERVGAETLRIAGIDVHPVESAPAAAAAEKGEPARPMPLEIDRVRLQDGSLAFRDRFVESGAHLTLALEELAAEHVVLDPARPEETVAVRARLAAPGMADRVTVDGTVAPFAPERRVDLAFAAEGLSTAAIEPYLREAGLEGDLRSGTFSMRLGAGARLGDRGRIDARASIADVHLQDEGERFALSLVSLDGIVLDPAEKLVRVGDAHIEGLRLRASRDATGSVHVLGVRTSAAPAAARRAEPGRPSSAPAASPLPRVEIGRLAWTGNAIRFDDAAVSPPASLAFSDLGAEIEGLAIGRPSTARVRAWAAAPGFVERSEASGKITTGAGPLDLALELALAADGLRAEPLRPYLAPLGIEPALRDGSFRAGLDARARLESGVVDARLALTDVALTDSQAPLASLGALRVDEVHVDPSGVKVASVVVDHPRLAVARDEDGSLRALGLRVPLTAKSSPAPRAAAAPSEPSEPSGSATPVSIAAVRVAEATIDWSDAAVEPAVAASAVADLEADAISTEPDGEPTRVRARLRSPDCLEDLAASATIERPRGGARASASVAVRGLTAGWAARYLPPNVRSELRDGRLRAEILAEAVPASGGGTSLRFETKGFELRDGESGDPLAAVDALVATAPRIDPHANVFALGEVSVAGARLTARRGSDGALRLLGLAVAPGPSAPARPASAANGVSTPPPRVPSRDKPPSVTLDKLDLELARFTFADEARPGSAPVDASLRVASAKPLDFFRADGESGDPPPVLLDVTGAAAPLFAGLEAHARLEPFAREPVASVSVEVRGLHGEGVTLLAPELSQVLDGRELRDGVLTAKLRARLGLGRRSPLDFDLSRGFAADAALESVELREGSGGELLAGLEALELEAERIDPKSGDLLVRSIEARNPRLRVRRDLEGIHAFGFLLKLPRPDGTAASSAAPPRAVAVEASTEPSRAPELRVDLLAVRGADVEIRDASAQPNAVFPIRDVDVEVRRFTTKGFTEPRPVRFQVSVGASEVELPKRLTAGSTLAALGGIGAAVGAKLAGEQDVRETERRRAFGEVALSGRLAFYPSLTGTARAYVGGLELVNLAGPARQQGVVIGDGVMDASVRLAFAGQEGASVDSRFTFSSLSLDEPPDGPISKYLTLPAPLDTVLFLLRNADDEQRIPLSFSVAPEGLSGGEIAKAAVATMAQVIANAVAAAPLRLAKGVTGLAGVGGGDERPARAGGWVRFASGSGALPPGASLDLAPVVDELRSDTGLAAIVEHHLGAADLARAEVVANPSSDECREIVSNLRQRKAELARIRDERAAEMRARFGVGGDVAMEAALARLRSLDRETQLTESALDDVLELLRPTAGQSREKRVRSACIALGRYRVAGVRNALVAAGLDASRIEVRAPRFETTPPDGAGEVVVSARPR